MDDTHQLFEEIARVKDRLLKRLHLSSAVRINLDSLSLSVDYLQMIEDAVSSMLLQLDCKIYGETYPYVEEFVVEYPSTAWEHFKHQYFPDWLKDMFPVKMKKVSKIVEIDFTAVYPDFKPAGGMDYEIILEVVNQPRSRPKWLD